MCDQCRPVGAGSGTARLCERAWHRAAVVGRAPMCRQGRRSKLHLNKSEFVSLFIVPPPELTLTATFSTGHPVPTNVASPLRPQYPHTLWVLSTTPNYPTSPVTMLTPVPGTAHTLSHRSVAKGSIQVVELGRSLGGREPGAWEDPERPTVRRNRYCKTLVWQRASPCAPPLAVAASAPRKAGKKNGGPIIRPLSRQSGGARARVYGSRAVLFRGCRCALSHHSAAEDRPHRWQAKGRA